MSLLKSKNSTFSSVLMETGVSFGSLTPSRAQYNSRSRSGLLNSEVKTPFLNFEFIVMNTSALYKGKEACLACIGLKKLPQCRNAVRKFPHQKPPMPLYPHNMNRKCTEA
jgi:hypothetical protein